MRGGCLPTEPGLAGAEAPHPPLLHDMGSQPSTFSLSWILYLSQAWHAGVLVGGETRGDARLTGYFLPSAGLAWPPHDLPSSCPLPPPVCWCPGEGVGPALPNQIKVTTHFPTCFRFGFCAQYHLFMRS